MPCPSYVWAINNFCRKTWMLDCWLTFTSRASSPLFLSIPLSLSRCALWVCSSSGCWNRIGMYSHSDPNMQLWCLVVTSSSHLPPSPPRFEFLLSSLPPYCMSFYQVCLFHLAWDVRIVLFPLQDHIENLSQLVENQWMGIPILKRNTTGI